MKVLATYASETLPILRRVSAPYSLLAERGHACHFRESPSLDPEIAFSYDLVVLPNLVPDPDLLDRLIQVSKQGGNFVYDLSSPELLQDEGVQRLLPHCIAVITPNQHLNHEVDTFYRSHGSFLAGVSSRTRLSIVPSVVHRAYLVQGNDKKMLRMMRETAKIPEDAPVIGCLGNAHDWEVVLPALLSFVAKHPRVRVLCTEEAYTVFSANEELRPHLNPVPLTIGNYPYLLGLCDFGLCPRLREDGRDTVWALEYGILAKPVIASTVTGYQRQLSGGAGVLVENTNEAWEGALKTVLSGGPAVSPMGMIAFERANAQRTSAVADHFLAVLRKNLPRALALR